MEKITIRLIEKEICFSKQLDSKEWSYKDENNSLIILENNDNNYDLLGDGLLKLNYEDDILIAFIEKKIKIEEIEKLNFLVGIEEEEEEEEEGTEEINDPYNPELIRVDPRNFAVNYIHELINEKELNLSPDFQRNFVWNNITKKSRLIESLLLRIPLPVFYFSQNENGSFQVVDGVQRLTVINSYLNNEFKLKNLEYLKEAEGKYWKKLNSDGRINEEESLSTKFTRRVNQTQLMINIIDPQTPSKVKFDIFKRINTGGEPLNPQEIRNCLSNKVARDFLKDLSQMELFKDATNHSLKSIRMSDQDLILRFIAFYYSKKIKNNFLYKGKMESFLDSTIELLNLDEQLNRIKIRKAFINALNIANYLLGNYAFRKIKPVDLEPESKKVLINKSLFITTLISFCDYDFQKIKENYSKNYLVNILAEKILNSEEYADLLTNATTDPKRLEESLKIFKELLKNNLYKEENNE